MSEFDKNHPEDERPSKSQRKRDMIALQKIGETLVNLSLSQLEKVPMDESLRDAVMHARTVTSGEGKRRQMQYIGRLMRDVDAKPIEEALEKIQLKHQQSNAKFHQLEKLRDKLIAEGDKQLEEFLAQYPKADIQHLRQLIRNAQRGKAGSERELFRYLRELAESSG